MTLLKQKKSNSQIISRQSEGFTLWLTGLPCAGKTTIALELLRRLAKRGIPVEGLDGDVIRKNLSRDLGFSKQERLANIERVGYVASLLTRHGVVTVVSLVSPYRSMRDKAREIIGRFVEIYVSCPLDVCEARDVKGMYKLARQGTLHSFTGVSDPYEKPLKPEITVHTDKHSPQESVQSILKWLEKKAYIQAKGLI